MSEETKVLITGPGTYPTKQGPTTIEPLTDETHPYYMEGYRWIESDATKNYRRTYMPDGRFDKNGHINGNTGGDIIGPRIEDAKPVPQPTVQDGIIGVKPQRGMMTPEEIAKIPRINPPSAMERYGAYATIWPQAQLTVNDYGTRFRCEILRHNRQTNLTICRNFGYGATPDLALAAAMDVLEGLA